MLKRQHYVADRESLGDAETKVFDIDYMKPISAIDILIRITAGGTASGTTPIPRIISDISIVDGSFNLISGIMAALMANQWHSWLSRPIIHFEVANDVVNAAMVRIHFGRFLGDKDIYLDPQRFNNLQLRITNAMVVSAGQYATGTANVTVIAHVLEKASLNHKGVIMTKQQAFPTLVASAQSSYDLPVDYPYAGILMCGTDGTADLETVISRIKASLDADAVIACDVRAEHLHHQNMSMNGPLDVNNDIYLDFAVSNGIGLAPATVLLEYVSLFGGLYLPLGDLQNNDFFDPTAHNSFKLFLTAGSAGGATRIISNQLYTK